MVDRVRRHRVRVRRIGVGPVRVEVQRAVGARDVAGDIAAHWVGRVATGRNAGHRAARRRTVGAEHVVGAVGQDVAGGRAALGDAVGVGMRRRDVVDHVDVDRPVDRVPVVVGRGVGERVDIAHRVGAVVGGRAVDRAGQRVAVAAVRVERQRAVRAGAAAVERERVRGGPAGDRDLAVGIGLAGRARVRAARKTRLVDQSLVVAHAQGHVIDVDRQRRRRLVPVTIRDGVGEDVGRIRRRIRVRRRCVGVAAVRIERQRAVSTHDRAADPGRHHVRRVAARLDPAHPAAGVLAVRTEHVIRLDIARDRAALVDAVGVGRSSWDIVANVDRDRARPDDLAVLDHLVGEGLDGRHHIGAIVGGRAVNGRRQRVGVGPVAVQHERPVRPGAIALKREGRRSRSAGDDVTEVAAHRFGSIARIASHVVQRGLIDLDADVGRAGGRAEDQIDVASDRVAVGIRQHDRNGHFDGGLDDLGHVDHAELEGVAALERLHFDRVERSR